MAMANHELSFAEILVKIQRYLTGLACYCMRESMVTAHFKQSSAEMIVKT